MNTMDFTNYIKSNFGLTNVYPNTIPDNDNINTGVFLYDSFNDLYAHTNSVFVQLIFSSTQSRTELEAYANTFMKKLDFHFPCKVGDSLVVGIHKLQLQPFYLGEKNNVTRFSLNLQLFLQE